MKRIVMIMLASLAFAAPTQAQAVAEKDVLVHGFKMHYLEAGNGPTLVLLHGTGGEGARWTPQLQGLSRDFRVLAFDQIGFGSSDKPMTQYHTGVFADFIVGALQKLNVAKASFMGQSMGANVVLYITVHNPALVDRIVLVNGGGFRAAGAAAPTAGPIDWHRRQISNAATLEESKEYLHTMYFDDAKFVTPKAVEDNLTLRLKSAYTISSMQEANVKGLGFITEADVRAIAKPTLLVWGFNDTESPPANADRLNAVIAGSRKVFVDKAGHYPFLEHPAEFNESVREFLLSSTAQTER